MKSILGQNQFDIFDISPNSMDSACTVGISGSCASFCIIGVNKNGEKFALVGHALHGNVQKAWLSEFEHTIKESNLTQLAIFYNILEKHYNSLSDIRSHCSKYLPTIISWADTLYQSGIIKGYTINSNSCEYPDAIVYDFKGATMASGFRLPNKIEGFQKQIGTIDKLNGMEKISTTNERKKALSEKAPQHPKKTFSNFVASAFNVGKGQEGVNQGIFESGYKRNCIRSIFIEEESKSSHANTLLFNQLPTK